MSHSTDPTDQLLRGANPVDDATLAGLGTAEAATALRDAIVADPGGPGSPGPAEGRRASRAGRDATHTTSARPARRRRLAALGLATTGIAVAIVLGVSNLGAIPGGAPGADDSGVAWAAGAVKVARAVPRLLPGEPGWTVTRVDELDVVNGSTTLSKGTQTVEYNWYPRAQYDSYFKDRQLGTERYADIEVEGVPAAVFRYTDSEDGYFAMWKLGDYFVEARAQALIPEPWKSQGMPAGGPEAEKLPTFSTNFSLDSFRAFVTSLESVDVNTWLSAMPPSVVKPQDNAKMIDTMLEGVPLPEGFDREALENGGEAVRDRYQLGAKVSGAVLCGWFKEWRAADRAGDMAHAELAKKAVGTAKTWGVLEMMDDEGAFPEIIREDAELFARGETPGRGQDFEAFWRRQFCQ